MGHDQLFKRFFSEFLQDFLELFYPEVAARLDFTTLELLDKELFTDFPEGSVREADVVARVQTREGGRRSFWFISRSSLGRNRISLSDVSVLRASPVQVWGAGFSGRYLPSGWQGIDRRADQHIVFALSRVTAIDDLKRQRSTFESLLTRYSEEEAEAALQQVLRDRKAIE